MKEKTFIWKGKVVLKFLMLSLLALCSMVAFPVHAQDDPMLYKEIQLSKKWYTFDELTHIIQQQTGITFSYNASKITGDRRFRVKDQRMTAIKLLAVIKRKSGIGYKAIHPGFIVYQVPENTPHKHRKSHKKQKAKTIVPRRAGPVKQLVITSGQRAVPGTGVSSSADSAPQTIIVIGDSTTASGYYFGGGVGGGSMGSIEMVMRYPGKDDNVVNPYASLNPPGGGHQQQANPWNQGAIGVFFRKNFLLGVGLSADETYYLSPALHFGFRFLYADLSYNVGDYSQFRYGLGAEAQINEHWALGVGISTGKSFSKSYVYTTFDTVFPPPDSSNPTPLPVITETNTPLFVQSRLTRFSLSAIRKINKDLSISGSLVINRLSTQYFSRDQPFDLNSLEPPVIDADNRFRTMKPPYVLSRSYSPAGARLTQLWLGFRVSVFYRLNFSDN
ncbi:MAG TPA: hypothetical protein VFL76_03765 [Edaphocola sp.]|nr:hypothetical protein [Edaphocola sp.]